MDNGGYYFRTQLGLDKYSEKGNYYLKNDSIFFIPDSVSNCVYYIDKDVGWIFQVKSELCDYHSDVYFKLDSSSEYLTSNTDEWLFFSKNEKSRIEVFIYGHRPIILDLNKLSEGRYVIILKKKSRMLPSIGYGQMKGDTIEIDISGLGNEILIMTNN